jgi:hypothetical protein
MQEGSAIAEGKIFCTQAYQAASNWLGLLYLPDFPRVTQQWALVI